MQENKKRILIIYPQLDIPYSGGQVIDFFFVQQLTNSKKYVYNYLLESMITNTSILGYIYYTLRNFRKITQNDIIFTNSRLYPRLLLCFCLLKIFCRNIKIMVYHHHFNYYTRTRLSKYIHKFFELSFLKITDIIIIPSPYIKDEMKKVLPNSNSKYIEIGFDLNPYFNKDKIKTNNLLYVGTVNLRKGIHHLIYLTKFLVGEKINFHIDIVGSLSETQYVKSMQKMIYNYHLNEFITLWGRVDENELDILYKKADIFVFPSSHEGYGMVLIEALSYGLPVVAFNNSAMPYSIKNSFNGILASDGNVQDFCYKVKKILLNEDLWNKLRYNAHQSIANIRTLQQMQDEMKQFIDVLGI
jgi:glycosyltransferase involved in cell wall biosynthesis